MCPVGPLKGVDVLFGARLVTHVAAMHLGPPSDHFILFNWVWRLNTTKLLLWDACCEILHLVPPLPRLRKKMTAHDAIGKALSSSISTVKTEGSAFENNNASTKCNSPLTGCHSMVACQTRAVMNTQELDFQTMPRETTGRRRGVVRTVVRRI